MRPLHALNTAAILIQQKQYSDLIDFNILLPFGPILHRGLTSALRGLCVCAWRNRETLSGIDRLGLREPPSVPRPLCLQYRSPCVNVFIHVPACTYIPPPTTTPHRRAFFLCDAFCGISSIISQRGSGGGPLALICCVIGH